MVMTSDTVVSKMKKCELKVVKWLGNESNEKDRAKYSQADASLKSAATSRRVGNRGCGFEQSRDDLDLDTILHEQTHETCDR